MSVAVMKEESWKSKIDKLEIDELLPFPKDKRNYLARLVSFDFHALTEKRFTVSYATGGTEGEIKRIA